MSGQTSERALDQRFAEAMGQHLGPNFPNDIALAVSGGGDSMAMLTLAHNWARIWGVKLWVVTVDHGLREGSADEAQMVAEECAALGHPHATLRWHWDGNGNLMDAARRARLGLIDRWRGGIDHVLMAHTRDDVAETFLMRLARGSGVEGLAAMAAARRVTAGTAAGEINGDRPPQPGTRRGGFQLFRPCLDMTRAELRHYLTTLKGRWVEDPSNDDPRFERARIRKALNALEDAGLTRETLAETADAMTLARATLRARARSVWKGIGQEVMSLSQMTGELAFDRAGFEATERDTQLRLLAEALRYVATADYRPRLAALSGALDVVLGGGATTLHGCEMRMERERLLVFRELKALDGVAMPVTKPGKWDGRWTVVQHDFRNEPEIEIRALGEAGWQQIADIPDGAPAYASARSLPALWRGDALLACPHLSHGTGHAKLWPMGRELWSFARHLASH